MTKPNLSNLQAILAEVFEFSSADIVANLQGKLSAAQRERIACKHYESCRFAWITFATVFGVGLLGFSAEMIRLGSMNIESLRIYFRITAFFALIVWAFIFYYRRQMKHTLREGKAQPVDGEIWLTTERGEKLVTRYFCVRNYRFSVDYKHFVLIQESGLVGQSVTLYVSAPWRSVLSIALQG